MKKFIYIFSVFIVVLGLAIFMTHFLTGPEDTWICQNGQWVKHGQPNFPQPASVCDISKD